MRKDTLKNTIKIVSCLEKAGNDWLWIREVARACRLGPATVSRLLSSHLSTFVESRVEERPVRIHMIRLKPGIDSKGVLRFLAVKEKLSKK
jgi:hypothetical protein